MFWVEFKVNSILTIRIKRDNLNYNSVKYFNVTRDVEGQQLLIPPLVTSLSAWWPFGFSVLQYSVLQSLWYIHYILTHVHSSYLIKNLEGISNTQSSTNVQLFFNACRFPFEKSEGKDMKICCRAPPIFNQIKGVIQLMHVPSLNGDIQKLEVWSKLLIIVYHNAI